jgi:hypothetical protein
MKRILSGISLLALAVILTLFLTWKHATPIVQESVTSDTSWKTESFYVDNMPKQDLAVVFVHGIFGDSRQTWTAPNGFYWPTELSKDKALPPMDVFVYSFPSPYLGRTYTLDDLVNDFIFCLASNHIFEKHKMVVFVGHSMGGIVVRSALLRLALSDHPEFLSKVPFIFQYATPSEGAEVAQLASSIKASKNPQLLSLLPTGLERSTELDRLRSDWGTYRQRGKGVPMVFCAFETKETFGFLIVSPNSARSSCDGVPQAIIADHIDIVKPMKNTAKPYALLSERLQSLRPQAVLAQPLLAIMGTVVSTSKEKLTVGLSGLSIRVPVKPGGNFAIKFHGISGHSYTVVLWKENHPTNCARVVTAPAGNITIDDGACGN